MSKSKNKPKHLIQVTPKTDKQYLTSGMARKLPIAECWINPNWQEQGFATIIVAREHKSGAFTVGTYLVDVFCLGLKQTMYFVNMPPMEYEDKVNHLFSMQNRAPVDYVLAHNIIYGGIAYADDLGFKPDKDWALSQYVLEPDEDESIELIEIEFGKNGRPFYVGGPYDKQQEIIHKLQKAVGPFGFLHEPYVRENDPLAFMDDEEEWDEEDEDE
jgi:hypothetical protein